MIMERLKMFIDSQGITIKAFERSIGMSNASFGKSLKNGGNIGSDKVENILQVYPQLNPSWAPYRRRLYDFRRGERGAAKAGIDRE